MSEYPDDCDAPKKVAPTIRLLDAFNRWFTSAPGVIQTFALVTAIVVYEFINPNLDPHGFWIMWALTVYSGITQPLLAYVSSKSAKSTDKILDRIEEMLSDEVVVDRATYQISLNLSDRLKVLEEIQDDC